MTTTSVSKQAAETVLSSLADQADSALAQYVTFVIGECAYGIEITKVREIKGWSEPTELPNSAHAMRGVLNLRGVIVPIFDLRARFGQGRTETKTEHVVIIVALGKQLIGVLVDAVSDILTLEPNEVLSVPDVVDGGIDQSFLAGLVSRQEKLIALLRLEKLFGGAEIDSALCM